MNLIMPSATLDRLAQRAKAAQPQPQPKTTKVPIGAKVLMRFGEEPIFETTPDPNKEPR